MELTPYEVAARLVDSARRRAKRKGLEFDMEYEVVLGAVMFGFCAVTGLKFCLKPKAKLGNPWYPSLDRIDPKGGYTTDNVQVVVWAYNKAKGFWDHEVLVTLAQSLA